jgi:polysaccharide biosynthesis/export protein
VRLPGRGYKAVTALALWGGLWLPLATGQAPAVDAPKDRPPVSQELADYVLGPGDSFTIYVVDGPEIMDHLRAEFTTGSDGYVMIPLVGRLHSSGLSVLQLQEQIAAGLRRYVHEPQVYVTMKTLKSQPVSVLGAVNVPGVHQLYGPKRLAEVLALAGGLSKDAGYRITITRSRRWGAIPLPGATFDSTGEFSTAEVNARALTEADSPKDNIWIRPDDVISVPRAQVVYVIGEVNKAGGFTLGDEDKISLLQALALAGGVTRLAAPANARILRPGANSSTRTAIKVNVRKIISGKAEDTPLNANDILLIPDSASKRLSARVGESAIQTISGLIIWRGL